jgi:hypothetical protein
MKIRSKLVFDYPKLILKILILILTSWFWVPALILFLIGMTMLRICMPVFDIDTKKWFWY